LACLTVCVHSAFATDYQYTARFEHSLTKTGAIVLGGIKWSCLDRQCVTTGPWPTPGVAACAALANSQQIRITSYGHSKKGLSTSDLETCNKSVVSTPAISEPKVVKPQAITAKPPKDMKAPQRAITSAESKKMSYDNTDKEQNSTTAPTKPQLSASLANRIGKPVTESNEILHMENKDLPASTSSKAQFLSVAEKLQVAGINMGGGIKQPIRIDAQNPYNGQYQAGFTVYNGTHEPAANRYVIRPVTQSGGHEATRYTIIYWRGNANTRYLLDCALENNTGTPFVISATQRNPNNKMLGSFQDPSNLALVIPANERTEMISLDLRLSKVGRDANPAAISVSLRGCEITPLN
jgi:hypothetical protein